MFTKTSQISLPLFAFWAIFLANGAMSQSSTIISGFVYDSSTSLPLQGVTVEVEESDDASTALTNKKGKYSIVVTGLSEVRISFSKEGYQPTTALLKLTEPSLRHDVRLEQSKLSIEMTEFKSGSYIRGKVHGMSPSDFVRHKILVYILTDKWYLHPFAEDSAGRGFAAINSQGNWEIDTMWRGNQAYKIAFLLVARDFYPPSPIELLQGKNPEVALQNAIAAIAAKIDNAPKGI